MAYIPQYNAYGMNYPQSYGGMSYNPQPTVNQPQQAQTIQNGGFIPVPSEDVARNYPVAHGNSVTFINENAPFVYTKTLGFGQLEQPIFVKYRLIKEEDVQDKPQEALESPQKTFATADEVDSLRITMKHMKADLDNVRTKMEKLTGKRNEVKTDD